jgi:hypothetical protein
MSDQDSNASGTAAALEDAPGPEKISPEQAFSIGRYCERLRLRLSSETEAEEMFSHELRLNGVEAIKDLDRERAESFTTRLMQLCAAIPPKGFSREAADPFVSIKLGFPAIWPQTAAQPMVLKMDYLLSDDADKEQTNYIGLTDEEQVEATYHYDCKMISLLACRVPEGFVDFPEIAHDGQGRPTDPEGMRQTIFDYFYIADEERSKAMRFVVRRFMTRYWSKIMPTDYL